MHNSICISFPKITRLSVARKKAIKARLNTYDLNDFRRLFEMAEGSAFLKGKNNRNWLATFDWLIADSNMAKVLDGNYKDAAQIPSEATVPPQPDLTQQTRRLIEEHDEIARRAVPPPSPESLGIAHLLANKREPK